MQMKKKTLALLGAMILSVALTGCGGEESPVTGDSDKELTKLTLCLDWTPNTNHTGIYVAQAKGYLADAGIELAIVQPPENGAAAMCAAGQAQFAIDAQDTLAPAFARTEPLGITAVAALVQHNTSGILSRQGEGLDRPKGLAGKTYSTWDNPTELAILKNLVEQDGGDFGKVNLIPNTVTNEAGALREKQTDAVWIYYGWSGIATELDGLPFDYFALKDLNPVFDYYTPVLIANNDYLAQEPAVVKAFLAAVQKGYEYAAAQPAEAAQILMDGDTTGSLVDAAELVQKSQVWLADQYLDGDGKWGSIDPARWDGFYAWLSENGLVETALPAGTGFSNEFLSK